MRSLHDLPCAAPMPLAGPSSRCPEKQVSRVSPDCRQRGRSNCDILLSGAGPHANSPKQHAILADWQAARQPRHCAARCHPNPWAAPFGHVGRRGTKGGRRFRIGLGRLSAKKFRPCHYDLCQALSPRVDDHDALWLAYNFGCRNGRLHHLHDAGVGQYFGLYYRVHHGVISV